MEFVVSRPPVISPVPDSLTALPAVKLTAPVVVRLPVFSVTFCPASSVNAPDPLTTSALSRISLAAPVAVRLMAPLVAACTIPVTLIVPASITETLPPVSLIPVTFNPPVLLKLMSPLEVFLAFKALTRFELFSVVPAEEFVVNRSAEISPEPVSLMAMPAVKLTAPIVVRLPVLSVRFFPAFSDKLPETLVTSALTRMSLVAPVAVSPIVPFAAA